MLFVLGVAAFMVGIGVSIAWHELGHFAAARRFGVRVSQFMVGWGPTVFSRRVGETEFGLKALPVGGYIRMIGMVPPAPGQTMGRSRRSGLFRGLIDDVRAQSAEELRPGDADRQLYTRAPWKRVVVMGAGPVMNLVLAVALFAVVLMGIGTPGTMTVGSVDRCILTTTQAAAQNDPASCPPGAAPTPAAAAGLRPGDRIVALDGVGYERWEQFRRAIRTATGPTTLEVVRDGTVRSLAITPVQARLPRLDGGPGTETAAFLGYSTTGGYERQPVGFVATEIGRYVNLTAEAIVALPARVPDLLGSVFAGEPRSLDDPVSVVGVARIGGESLTQGLSTEAELSLLLNLLAGVNLSLFALNLVPLLPFDGGHIAAAVWESVRRRLAALRGRCDPGPVDLARLMPVTYCLAVLIMTYGALVITADIINPIQIFS